MSPFLFNRPVRAAVVTGGHAFDVPQFHKLLRNLPGIDPYLVELDNLAADVGKALGHYDVLAFYFMPRSNPQGKVLDMLERLGEKEQGIVLLHHSILAYPEWPHWSQIVGIADRTTGFEYHDDEKVTIDIRDEDHPITRGLRSWTMVDETYKMNSAVHGTGHDAGPNNDILLTTDHPLSLRSIGWTRRIENARVFCFACGHGPRAYGDRRFRKVLARGIRWAGGKL